MKTTVKRIRVALKTTKYKVPLLIVLAQYIYAAMTANAAQFTAAATTLLATLATQITALTGAQEQVKIRAVGAVGARDTKRDALILTLENLRVLVQGLCDGAPEQAIALIQAAGMKAVSTGARFKALLAVTLGVQPGTVNLVANAALLSSSRKKKTYNWSYSLDGKTWLSAPSTPYAKTTIEGLPSLATCEFRVNVSVGDAGPGPWSQAVSIVVH